MAGPEDDLRQNWHTYQVLTKRAGRLRDLLSSRLSFAADSKHIWWGTSVEDHKYGVPRIAELRDASAAVRFLSVEPLIDDVGKLDLRGIHWVIVGGESGAGARPMKKEWVVDLMTQCKKARVPFFFKQWGGVRKSEHGRELDGLTYDEMPSRVSHAVPTKQVRQAMISEVESWRHAGAVPTDLSLAVLDSPCSLIA
jgi:protein gp37